MTTTTVQHKWINHDSSGRHRTCDKCKMRVDRFGIGKTSYHTWSIPGGIGGDTQDGSTVPGCLGYPDPSGAIVTIPRVIPQAIPCRCGEYTATSEQDMDEHVLAMMSVSDGKHHGPTRGN